MYSAPITEWKDVSAYFTFADKPAVLVLLTLVGVAVCGYSIFSMVKHENASYKKNGH
jgi:hypothetical protein